MSDFFYPLENRTGRGRPIEMRAVWAFTLLTLVLSVGVLFLLPGLAGPAIIVFIPTILAAVLIRYTAGKGQVRRQLFSREQWPISLKWLLAGLGLALGLRAGVSLLALALVPGYQFQPGPFSPFLLMTLLFAAGEEIGWRGFALPAMLANGYRPLTAALILGLPWALMHLPLVLPGMLSEGTPMAAQFLVILALSVLTSWVYLSGGSLTAAVLLHGGQNITVILNNGLDPVSSGWLMAAVYGIVAVVVILLTKGRLGLPAAGNK
jgi:membrane protease YdiL (CAAX protease family)